MDRILVVSNVAIGVGIVFLVKQYWKIAQPDYNGSFIHSDVSDLPESVDWRDIGAVTSIDDQGLCRKLLFLSYFLLSNWL